MDIDTINRLKKSFPTCYPREAQIDMDKFEDEFATWPTDPEPQLDRKEIFEDRMYPLTLRGLENAMGDLSK